MSMKIAIILAALFSVINFIRSFSKKKFKAQEEQLKKIQESLDKISDKITSLYPIHSQINERLSDIEDKVEYVPDMTDTVDRLNISMIEIKERLYFLSFMRESVRPMPQLQIPIETNSRSEAAKKAWATKRSKSKGEESEQVS